MAATMVLTWVALPVPKRSARRTASTEMPGTASACPDRFDVVHRAADPLAGGAALSKMYSERDLRKFGAHTQQRRAPHQNTAPGPPIAIAPATPAMLPVPTVPASAVQTAWNGVIAPSEASFCGTCVRWWF